MKILCGPLFLNFEDSENVFDNIENLINKNDPIVSEAPSEKPDDLLSRFKSVALEKGLEELEKQADDDVTL